MPLSICPGVFHYPTIFGKLAVISWFRSKVFVMLIELLMPSAEMFMSGILGWGLGWKGGQHRSHADLIERHSKFP